MAALTTSDRDRTIVGSVGHLAGMLGGTAVAEGIEDEATAEVLRAMGCPVGQGWLYGRPTERPARDGATTA